ncbi:hypothetical protein [Phreatobacter sp.]|uniref:hypothetical protein n=1 Tax=Phreatobacter sp. TaxID=1966341 RepID=UPI003F70B562
MNPARTETYEHTISGLLAKRVDLYHEAERIRDRLAEIRNDLSALDRVLHTLGYAGNLDTDMPRQKHERIFGQGELTRAVLDALRDAPEPMASRDIAREVIAVNEQDARDRRLLTEVTRRVSKVLRIQSQAGRVRKIIDATSRTTWAIALRV